MGDVQITALEWIRKLRGGSQSHLMRCSDNHAYVVKFRNNPQGRRILAAEYLGTKFAALLGLPVPHCSIVEVSASLIGAKPEMAMYRGEESYEACLPGLQFGSRFIGGLLPGHAVDYISEASLAEVRNLHEFAGILVFDKWTCNADGRQAVFHRKLRQRRYTATFIDHGYCFAAGDWEFKDYPLRGVYARNLPYAAVTGWQAFEPWLSRLKELKVEALWQAAAEMPSSWYDDATSELEQLIERLWNWRARVPDLLTSFRHCSRKPFPRWTEG